MTFKRAQERSLPGVPNSEENEYLDPNEINPPRDVPRPPPNSPASPSRLRPTQTELSAKDKVKTYINLPQHYELNKIGTWNKKSTNRKEKERIQEFKKAKLEILMITETKRKGIREVVIEGHGILLSGVKMVDWKVVNKRMMKVNIRGKEKKSLEKIVVYVPGENDLAMEKEIFWNDLQNIYDDVMRLVRA
ncbi:hypothetical protein FQA39_LY09127 [Lamprigera yunnana]|nr:hypothetical protein FQA39_LY09127 [Lamprigera yunnana]